jgi:hypothetical protein
MAVGLQYAVLSTVSSLLIDYVLHTTNPGLARTIANIAIYALYRYWLRNFELDDEFLKNLASRPAFLWWLGRIISLGLVGIGALLIGSVPNPSLLMLYVLGIFFGWELAAAVISRNLRRLRRQPAVAAGGVQ